MSELRIREVDPASDAEIIAWQGLVNEVMHGELGEHAVVWSAPELMVSLRAERRHRKVVLTLGELDGRIVAAGSVELPLLDNLTAARPAVWVAEDVRRQGHGSAVLRHLEALSAEHGRSRFDAEVEYPYAGPADGAGVAGVEFGRFHGYGYGIGDVQRELPLPVADDLLEELAAAAAPYHQDYKLRAWAGRVPDDLVVGWLELSSTLETEAPAGDMERENAAVDVDAFRLQEAIIEKQGRTKWCAVALDPEGRVVAYTDMVQAGEDQRWVFQWGTLVHRDHRGHRLGLAVKVANLIAMQRNGTDVAGRRLVTWNAEVNDHMIAINEALGFVKGARTVELQKRAA